MKIYFVFSGQKYDKSLERARADDENCGNLLKKAFLGAISRRWKMGVFGFFCIFVS